MKRIASALILLTILLSSIFTAYSASAVSFRSSECEVKKNRLFTIDIIAKGDMKLCAATFEFTYDEKMFAYRKVTTTKPSEIDAVDKDGTVKALYLDADGKSVKNGEVIFTLTFKALETGTGYINFTVRDVVDSDVKFANVSKCTAGKITVIPSKSSDDKNSSSSSSNSKNNSSEKSDDYSDNSEVINETTDGSNPAENRNWLSFESFDRNDNQFLIYGIVVGVSVSIIVVIIFVCMKHWINKMKAKNNSEKEKIKKALKEDEKDEIED